MDAWYYGSSVGQHGPVPEAELRRLIAEGVVGPETMVWKEGMAEWQRMSDVPVLLAAGYAAPGPGGYEMAYGAVGMAQSSGLAVASLVCGIIGIVACYVHLLLGIPAVICGHMALSKIRRSEVPLAGRGMALAGLIMGYISIVLTLLWAALFGFAFFSAASSIKSHPRPPISIPSTP